MAAQGGDPELSSPTDIQIGKYTYDITAKMCGYVNGITNKELVRWPGLPGRPRTRGRECCCTRSGGTGWTRASRADHLRGQQGQAGAGHRTIPQVQSGDGRGHDPAEAAVHFSSTTVIERTFCPGPSAPQGE